MGRTNVYGKRGDGMKATGIVRRIDELGRIVIPKEIRRTLRIRESDPVEIYMGEAGEILLKKYSPLLGLQDVAEEYAQALNGAFGLTSAICDRESVVAAAGRERRKREKEEKKRQLYVAMTRAKSGLFIHCNTNVFKNCNILDVNIIENNIGRAGWNEGCWRCSKRNGDYSKKKSKMKMKMKMKTKMKMKMN